VAGGTLVSRRRAYLLLRRLRRSRARCLSPNPSVAAECPSRYRCFLSCCPCAAAEPLLLVPRSQPVVAALPCPCSVPPFLSLAPALQPRRGLPILCRTRCCCHVHHPARPSSGRGPAQLLSPARSGPLPMHRPASPAHRHPTLPLAIPVLPLVPSGSPCTRPASPAHPRPTLP
jgi:hypothetical protein